MSGGEGNGKTDTNGPVQTGDAAQTSTVASSADINVNDFIRELAKPAPAGSYAWIAKFKGDPSAAREGWWKGQMHDTRRIFPRINAENVYISVAVFEPSAKGRRKNEPHHVTAILADDVGGKTSREEVEQVLGAPSSSVETSPDNYHYWYFLQDAITDEQADLIFKGLKAINVVGTGDKAGHNCVRYGRAPIGINGKPANDNFAVRLADWQPQRRFTFEYFRAALNLDALRSSANGAQHANPATDEELRAKLWNGEDRHECLVSLSARFAGRGMSRGDAIAALHPMLDGPRGPCNRDGLNYHTRVETYVEQAIAKYRDPREPTLGAQDGESLPADSGVTIEDFRAYLPKHQYIFMPTGMLYPPESVNAKVKAPTGQKKMSASRYLDKFKSVELMTWAPGRPKVIEGQLFLDGGWVERTGCATFNLYKAPTAKCGDPTKATPWVDHLNLLYEPYAPHIIRWLAHRVQRPGEKINHSLVLTGNVGIGKDTILEPVKYAVGEWNCENISPKDLFAPFNPYVKSVLLVISEAHDLGDINRYSFHEHTKTLMAAPPNFLMCNEKNKPEHQVVNVCGTVITSNYVTGGMYLPADDRRHFVAGSNKTMTDFPSGYFRTLYGWYFSEGNEHITAYLHDVDLSDFDPKAPPEKTDVFWAIVDSNRAPEDSDIAELLEEMGHPDVITVEDLVRQSRKRGTATTSHPAEAWLVDVKNRRVIPHRLKAARYSAVRNPAEREGRWKRGGRNVTIYAREDLPVRDQIVAAQKLCR